MYDGNHLAQTLRLASVGRESTAFSTDPATGEVTSYGTLWQNAERVAAALIGLGVEPGDRVALQAEKSLGVLELYLGTMLAGAIHLPLNTAYTAAEVGYFLSDASPRIFVCDPARQEELAEVVKAANVQTVLTLDANGNGSLRDKASDAGPILSAVARGADDLAAFLYTSGTTGRSKGAMLTHGNLASNADTLRDLWQFTKDDVLIHALPLFHTHGLFVAINVTMVAGGAIRLHRAFNPDAILADFDCGTALMGVPTFYTRLLGHKGLSKESVGKMRLFISGSAPMLTETHHDWQARTCHTVLERYGMTETCMNTSNPYDGTRKAGTVGLPLDGVEMRIATPEGVVLPQGEIGGIEVRGENVFKGYWNMPEKTAEELRPDGWFITGDIGQIDEDGYLTIVGRSKDLIISGGYNIYPKEIESIIDQVAGVVESAAYGIPHADFGESVAVAVVRETGSTLTDEDILEAISGDLARFKLPRKIFFLDELPRNTMGKVQKNVLRSTGGAPSQ
ncbi:malonyl-CoA/methylmalonyl-CoA synthetase [Sulfitobacter brevis]|uniref:Malonyl-CoA/methylmalonyl-CoA synthetase n=1 Tax=Sulfitobacter brevis TaxID=74348 RepID=A0A1I2E3R4_9RHOB|nr:malonyl-CoA synthase [Sulfitobacter brevis]SFE87293.1 malonyl-CoA/methylmalonyl-CoA synthetase [Sulfitobacter brevis]